MGIVNTSSKPLFGIQLSGESTSTPIFGFEGDGICTYATGGSNTGAVHRHRSVAARSTPGWLHGRRLLQRFAVGRQRQRLGP